MRRMRKRGELARLQGELDRYREEAAQSSGYNEAILAELDSL